MANILSNFEGLPKLLIKKRSVFPNYFRLRTEGVLPTPASQSLIYWFASITLKPMTMWHKICYEYSMEIYIITCHLPKPPTLIQHLQFFYEMAHSEAGMIKSQVFLCLSIISAKIP